MQRFGMLSAALLVFAGPLTSNAAAEQVMRMVCEIIPPTTLDPGAQIVITQEPGGPYPASTFIDKGFVVTEEVPFSVKVFKNAAGVSSSTDPATLAEELLAYGAAHPKEIDEKKAIGSRASSGLGNDNGFHFGWGVGLNFLDYHFVRPDLRNFSDERAAGGLSCSPPFIVEVE